MRLRSLLLISALLLALLLTGCGGGKKSSSGTTPNPSVPTTTTATAKPVPTRGLTVSLKSEQALKSAKIAAFASLSLNGKPQGTQRLTTKPVRYPLTSGQYTLIIIFSTCKSNCAVVHNGVNLSPIPVNGDVSQNIVVNPSCRKVSFGTGIDCSATKISH